MSVLEAILIAIIEGLTEFLPVSSTAHMIFVSSVFNIQEDEFVKMFEYSIQFGAILAVVVLYWKKFFDFSKLNFFFKLALAVIPALVLGLFFDDMIEEVLGNPLPIAIVLILGGIVLLFVDKWFQNPSIHREEDITIKQAVAVGFWQCLAMMPGTSRAAASIIGGMQQKMNRQTAAEFSFFLAVPTMMAVTAYSVFLKKWDWNGTTVRGYEMITSDTQHIMLFLLGNIIAFCSSCFWLSKFLLEL